MQIEAREPTDGEIRAFWFTLPIDTEQVEELLGIDIDTDYYYITGKELPFADEVQEDILERFKIPAARRPYYIAYYIEGIAAIVKEWLRQDCADEVEMIADIIESSVRPRDGSHEK